MDEYFKSVKLKKLKEKEIAATRYVGNVKVICRDFIRTL